MITPTERKEIIKKFGKNENDSGSPDVQVALLTARINDLQGHFKKHIHDYHSNRGLLKMIGQRKSLLKYVARDKDRYAKLIKALGLRK